MITPRILCPMCDLKQPPAQKCRRCEVTFSYPAEIDRAVLKAMPTLAQAERDLILAAMARCGNAIDAAQMLGCERKKILRKLKEYRRAA